MKAGAFGLGKMKFMKLGSKPDSFQTDCNGMRFVATELPSDIIVNVGGLKFYLHKFPLLSKSSQLQKLVSAATEENIDEIHIPDIPGGSDAFEICAKFCYGMIVTLNAYNVVVIRCAAEYLEMNETVEKGNLIYKIEVFLNTSIFRSWRDSIIVVQSTKSLLPWSEDLKLVNSCIDSIALKASMDVSKVDWSYTYSRKQTISVPKDWWIEDLLELELDLFSRVIGTIKAMKRVSSEVIGSALKAYTYNVIERGNAMNNESFLEVIVGLLPSEKGSVSCSFLLRLLKTAKRMHCNEMIERNLMKRIGRQLDEAQVSDLLFPALEGENTNYDVEMVLSIVKEFVMSERKIVVMNNQHFVSDSAKKTAVGKLIDGYLAEISKNPNQSIDKFVELAGMVPADARPVHDELYHVIDLYLKGHPNLSKSERKKLCGLIDCKKLTPDATTHAVQNESLPLRLVVQVLFFEQLRAAAASTTCHGCSVATELQSGSNGSARSIVTEENLDSGLTPEDHNCLKSIVLDNGGVKGSHRNSSSDSNKASTDDKGNVKVKTITVPKKIFGKWLSNKAQGAGRGSGSDSTGSPDLAKPEEHKFTPARNGRHSVS